jgi:hypothetical protein
MPVGCWFSSRENAPSSISTRLGTPPTGPVPRLNVVAALESLLQKPQLGHCRGTTLVKVDPEARADSVLVAQLEPDRIPVSDLVDFDGAD